MSIKSMLKKITKKETIQEREFVLENWSIRLSNLFEKEYPESALFIKKEFYPSIFPLHLEILLETESIDEQINILKKYIYNESLRNEGLFGNYNAMYEYSYAKDILIKSFNDMFNLNSRLSLLELILNLSKTIELSKNNRPLCLLEKEIYKFIPIFFILSSENLSEEHMKSIQNLIEQYVYSISTSERYEIEMIRQEEDLCVYEASESLA